MTGTESMRVSGALRARKPTMDDVAARAGVSRTLVSFVMGGKPGAGQDTRRRVLEVAAELGYRPDSTAQLLARGRSRTLGVLLDLGQPFHADLVSHLYPMAKAAGYEVLLSASAPGRDENNAIEALLSHRCESLILLGPNSPQDVLERFEGQAVVVVVGVPMSTNAFDTVRSADRIGIRLSVDHLVELGHRTIDHIDGGSGSGAAARRDAYVESMHAHGLADFVRAIPGAHDEASGIAAGRRMVAAGSLPTAVLAGNDRCALGLIDSLDRAGVDVPRDVSIVGYDDSELAQFSRIDLTTVRQDVARLAQRAVDAAVVRLEDGTRAATDAVIEPELIVRGSTAAPRSAQRERTLRRRLSKPEESGAVSRFGRHNHQ